MKQVWNVIRFVIALSALCAAAALGQTPPSELEGSYSITDRAIELRWHVPDALPGPVLYNVYRKLDGDVLFQFFATAADRRYDDDSITSGLVYQYKVTAVYSGSVESAPTNIVSVRAGSDSAASGAGTLPPRSLVGLFDDRGAVELDWFGPDSMQQPLLYRIYRNGNGDSAFTMIGTAPEPEFDDTLVASHAHYGYYVTALYSGSFESVPSNMIDIVTTSVEDSSHDSSNAALRFTSHPGMVAPLQELFAYQPVVETQPAGLTVCFELHHGPDGMTINPSTGAISWTPGSLGVYEVEIRARICTPSSEGEAEQEFYLMVISGSPGQIGGHVTDESSQPVAHVRMKIFDATNGVFVLKTRTDSAGSYNFPYVNPGTYFIRADADSDRFEDVWYDGVKRLADATGIAVAESTSVVANFVLHATSDDSLGNATFSGTVRDSSGAGVGGARVTAFRSGHHAGGDDDLFNDDHHRHGTGDGDDDERSTLTDSSGSYHLNVDAGSYLVRAKAEGFLEQYWNGKSFLLEADPLVLSGDTSGIDFSLHGGRQPMTGTGAILGTVRRASDSTLLRSHVMGFQKNFMGQFTGFVASARSDSAGRYLLGSLPTGFYIVLAKHEDEFIPTFYTPAGGTALLDSASMLFVDGASLSGIDLYLAGDSADGLNGFEGEVESEHELPGKTAPDVPMALAPLPGTIVVITTAAGEVAGSTISDNVGSYAVAGLAPGDYTVTFQKPGMASVHTSATLAYANNAPSTSAVNALLTSLPSSQAGLMSVHSSWNLVSVPVNAPDLQKSSVFPDAASQAFGFTGAYQTSNVLEYGSGYWVKFSGNQVLSIPGSERLAQTVPVIKGWNLIGSLSYPVAVSSLMTTPANIFSTNFFAYGGGYSVPTVIEPGRGYWVKASEAGTLTMQVSAGAASAAAPAPVAEPGLNSVTISDDAGNAQTLSLNTGAAGSSSELPPAPPAGAFDIRFSSGNMIETVPAGIRTAREYPVSMQLTSRHLTITWSVKPDGRRYRLANEQGTTVASSDKGASTVTLGAAARLVLIAEPTSVPQEFALQQNYPNPFNPSTSIRFELPAASRASIRIYNLIGQEVALLLDNQELEAGAHSVVFDASRFASGVYLYRMDATRSQDAASGFSEVRKMVLIK